MLIKIVNSIVIPNIYERQLNQFCPPIKEGSLDVGVTSMKAHAAYTAAILSTAYSIMKVIVLLTKPSVW
jgi:hypothetical protein